MKALIIALALSIPASAAWASSDNHGPISQEVQTQLTERLVAEGYEVRNIQAENGGYEVYALRDGQRFELRFDQNLNAVAHSNDD